jgi:hypothetical protein
MAAQGPDAVYVHPSFPSPYYSTSIHPIQALPNPNPNSNTQGPQTPTKQPTKQPGRAPSPRPTAARRPATSRCPTATPSPASTASPVAVGVLGPVLPCRGGITGRRIVLLFRFVCEFFLSFYFIVSLSFFCVAGAGCVVLCCVCSFPPLFLLLCV